MTDPATPDEGDDPVTYDIVELDDGEQGDDDTLEAEGMDLGGLLGGGGIDLGAILEQAGQMQAKLAEAQDAVAATVVTGVAGGGAVRVEVTGGFEFRGVVIDPSAVDPAEVEMLQDLVLAALHHATDQIRELQSGSMEGLDLGGLGLG